LKIYNKYKNNGRWILFPTTIVFFLKHQCPEQESLPAGREPAHLIIKKSTTFVEDFLCPEQESLPAGRQGTCTS